MQVKSKTIVVSALVVGLVLLLWYQFLYSPMQSQASKANRAAQAAEQQASTYQKQLADATGAGKSADARKAELAELENAIPPTPALADLLRATDEIRASSGVAFQTIAPSLPTASSGTGTISVSITVQGSYEQAMSYIDELMQLRRLVIIDGVNVSAGAGAGASQNANGGPVGNVFAGQGASPTLQFQITARVFTQAVPASSASRPGAGGATASPAGATSSGAGGAAAK